MAVHMICKYAAPFLLLISIYDYMSKLSFLHLCFSFLKLLYAVKLTQKANMPHKEHVLVLVQHL